MRTFLLATVLMLAAACAGTPRRAQGAPARVVVVGVSVAEKPQARGMVGDVFGGEEPRDVVAREGAEALRSRGYEVVGVETVLGPAPKVEEAQALARQYKADATVVLVLTRLDLSSLQPLGRAEVRMESSVVGPDGRVLSSAERGAATSETLYRARTDWRSHVRQAVIQLVRELP